MTTTDKEMLIRFAEAITRQFADLREELDIERDLTKHLLQRINTIEHNGLSGINAKNLYKLLGLR